jgi:hypothetical protein
MIRSDCLLMWTILRGVFFKGTDTSMESDIKNRIVKSITMSPIFKVGCRFITRDLKHKSVWAIDEVWSKQF